MSHPFRRVSPALIVIASGLLGLATTVPASSAQQRSFVKSTGVDTNPCTLAAPTLLMGDLNEWYLWGRPLRWLHSHFRERPMAPPTFPARRPVFALDRIWVAPAGSLRRLQRHTSPLARIASDHLPLVAEVEL